MIKTWQDMERLFQSKLVALYPAEEVKQLFLLVFEHIEQQKSLQYAFLKNRELQVDTIVRVEQILAELTQARPIQHIFKEAFFYGNTFEVSEHTLIPRPETEELVDLIIKDHIGRADINIIDIGTGTGCIPISLHSHMPNNAFWAVDISADALAVAKRNARQHHADINFMLADILEWELIFPQNHKFDVIVSNPPYITPKEKEEMHRNVLLFEPHLALFVEEEAPLLFYDYIADFAKAHLNASGCLYFEINQYLSQETADILQKKGFTDVQIIRDINGADRIIKAKIN
ncbi:peptide chain release factor N(5)-glutamine methyltransferase [Sphingobacterium sp. Mn56C]|uniref:peptide chain release factor N(5)-glutamine methyltransferase n=1 Tax=Sphingobacterium sp. Mn56C TaxID=3395261 RepID=UPI003BC4D09B